MTDYLVKVEQPSSEVSFGDTDTLRRHYSLVLAINGLRDTNLEIDLMAVVCIGRTRGVSTHAIN